MIWKNEDYKEELKQQLYLLSNKSPIYKTKSKVIKKDKKKKIKKMQKINNLFIDFLLLKATDKANATLKMKNKKKEKRN